MSIRHVLSNSNIYHGLIKKLQRKPHEKQLFRLNFNMSYISNFLGLCIVNLYTIWDNIIFFT